MTINALAQLSWNDLTLQPEKNNFFTLFEAFHSNYETISQFFYFGKQKYITLLKILFADFRAFMNGKINKITQKCNFD